MQSALKQFCIVTATIWLGFKKTPNNKQTPALYGGDFKIANLTFLKGSHSLLWTNSFAFIVLWELISDTKGELKALISGLPSN